MKSISIVAMCIACVCVSCVENFDISQEESSDLIVIDAIVTDYDSVQTVYIRRDKESLGYRYEPHYDAFEDAFVSIEDDNGWSADFENIDNRGREFTLSGHQFEPGRTYTITVRIGEREFRATEKIVPLPDIDGLKFYAKENKEGDTAYNAIIYFKDNQPDVDNYYLINGVISRDSYASRYVELQRLSDVGLRDDLNGVAIEVGLGAEWYLDTHLWYGGFYVYELMTISKSNYDYYGVMGDQINSDGGVYKPTPTSPVSNFSGENVQGQFIAATKFVFSGYVTEDMIIER